MTRVLTRNPALTFILFAVLAAGSAATIWLALPHEREVTSLWILLVKLVPFALATEAVARLDPAWLRHQLAVMLVMVAAFAGYFLFFVPKIFFAGGLNEDFEQMYYYVLTLTPYLILALILAYRLGGGAAGAVRRMGYAMLLLMLSGAEDLAFLTVNNHTDPRFTPIPQIWSWASHMTVFLGHPPTKMQAYAFIAVHLLLAAAVLTVPVAWFTRFTRFTRFARPRSGPTGGAA